MKKYLFLIVALCTVLIHSACSEDKTTEPSKNTAPACQITAPAHATVHDIQLPLVIRGQAYDAENNISIVKLTVGNELIAEVTSVPFQYEVAPEKLEAGPLTISLYVEDKEGLSNTNEISITVKSVAELMVDSNGNGNLSVGYWTEENEVHVTADKRWNITIPEDIWLEFYDTATKKWVAKTSISGEGKTTLKVRSTANNLFEERTIQMEISTADAFDVFDIIQEMSPDILYLIEDDMFRMAAQLSAIMIGMDADADGMVTAFEAEAEPQPSQPYGFDAGSWGIKSVKGVENFPQIRHLDINSNPLTEVDLSGNPHLMSVHVQQCNDLKSLDITPCTQLMELGCNFNIFLSVLPDIMKIKSQIHTLGIFNRQPDQPSDMDFSGFSNMQRLYINDNGITSLNLTGCNKLWRLVANGNAFTELDLSEVDRFPDNQYLMDDCPNLKKIYVWQGFTLDFYNLFRFDEGVEIIEK